MAVKAEKVVKDALKLPREERAFVAEKLLESLDFEEPFPLSPEWKAELLRRCRELDEGKTELIPADDVLREAGESLE
ncbi:MAG: addiction module antitoxin RelB [Desulfobacteraceae bacterium]|nr:MAG: addiction module antitoxin RelB [Desulfobacteraceae bacterium]